MRTKIQIFGRIALVVALLLTAFAFAAPAQAQTKFTSYISGVQVANLSSTTEANVLLTAYSAATGLPDGSPLTDKIPANSSKTYFPISNVSSGFSGSLVISSDQTVAAISNILSSAGTPAGASYVGRSTGDQTVLLPLLVKDNAGFTTWYSVQNAGTGDASVSVAYSDGTNVAASTIKQGASKIYYQSQETHTSPVFAATITSDKPIVAAVIQESTDIIFSYTGFASTAASTEPVFPLVNANNAGFVTGIQIQNAGTQATSVELTYKPSSAGTECKETQSIPAKESRTFALAAFANGANSNCAAGVKFIGSAKVTANSTSQPLVGIGNQLGTGLGGAYVSFSDADAGESVAMPLIMDRNAGYYTGFSVQNIGTAPTTVNCTFQNSARTVSGTLQPGGALPDIQFNQLADKYVGSAVCTGTPAGSKLVAVVNELSPAAGDQFLVYEGTKRP